MPTQSAGPLTASQVASFHEHGYLVVEDVFADADLEPVIEEVQAAVDGKAAEAMAAGTLSQSYREFGFERQLAKISEETDSVALGIWNGVLAGPAFFNLLRHERLLDLAQQFIGPEIIASSVYRLRPKIPGHIMGPVPWHQDSGYFEPYCDAALVLTVWLPLVDATEANGCMWVMPDVHRGAVLPHHGRTGKPYLVMAQEAIPDVAPVCCPVPRGGVLLLSNRTPHASFENRSDMVRWSMDLRYQSAALPTNYPMTRLPGEQDGALTPGVPMACYPPEADFLVRSVSRPDEVVTTPERFTEVRKGHRSPGMTKRWPMRD